MDEDRSKNYEALINVIRKQQILGWTIVVMATTSIFLMAIMGYRINDSMDSSFEAIDGQATTLISQLRELKKLGHEVHRAGTSFQTSIKSLQEPAEKASEILSKSGRSAKDAAALAQKVHGIAQTWEKTGKDYSLLVPGSVKKMFGETRRMSGDLAKLMTAIETEMNKASADMKTKVSPKIQQTDQLLGNSLNLLDNSLNHALPELILFMEGEKKKISEIRPSAWMFWFSLGFVLLIILAAIAYIIVLGKILKLMIQTKESWGSPDP
jgi:hypothetical protein